MKKNIGVVLLFLLWGLGLAGCAAVPRNNIPSKVNRNDYIDLAAFCREYNFEYSFDTVDDIIRLYSSDKDIRLLLNSSVAASNGTIFYLKNPPLYRKGKIYLPRQLDELVSGGELISFKPGFVIKTVVIDPGHGGKDPGAISQRGLQEKKVNLIVSRLLKSELERKGFKVFLTRSRDTYLTLQQRVEIAKRYDADLFISVHANSNRSRKVKGAEIYYLTPTRLNSCERALKLAKRGSFCGQKLPSEVKTILWDMLITKNYSHSVEMANVLHFTFTNLGFNVKSPRRAPFYVLRHAYVPSVLVEMGYLSNRNEERALRKKHYQKQIAQAVALAVDSLSKRHSKVSKQ